MSEQAVKYVIDILGNRPARPLAEWEAAERIAEVALATIAAKDAELSTAQAALDEKNERIAELEEQNARRMD